MLYKTFLLFALLALLVVAGCEDKNYYVGNPAGPTDTVTVVDSTTDTLVTSDTVVITITVIDTVVVTVVDTVQVDCPDRCKKKRCPWWAWWCSKDHCKKDHPGHGHRHHKHDHCEGL